MCLVIIENCFVVAASYPFFSELEGNTTHFQNELKETLVPIVFTIF